MQVKLIIIGDSNVGKTNLLSQFTKEKTPASTLPTLGVEHVPKTVLLKNGALIRAQMWDTAGQEKFKAITKAHYRKCLGALIVYDITCKQSFDGVKKWYEEIKENAESGVRVLLVGNKVDKVHKDPDCREVTQEDAMDFAAKHEMRFLETSAKENIRVKEAFESLLEEIFEKFSNEEYLERFGQTGRTIIVNDKNFDPNKTATQNSWCCQ